MAERWLGIDNGYSKMTIAVLDQGEDVIALERTYEPFGDGHDREVALARLRLLLRRLDSLKQIPVHLAGYCYEHAGVLEAFEEAGWIIEGWKALNDVVGFYGLTDISGNTIVCGCGSFSQVVYADKMNAICWPGEDVVVRLPHWLLCGWEYAAFLLDLSRRENAGELALLAQEVREIVGGETLESSGHRWLYLGPLLERLLGRKELEEFLARAVGAVLKTREIFLQHIKAFEPPKVVIGGGAVRSEGLWIALRDELRKQQIDVIRVQGEPAIGLARFAANNPDVDAWAFVGHIRPSWL